MPSRLRAAGGLAAILLLLAGAALVVTLNGDVGGVAAAGGALPTPASQAAAVDQLQPTAEGRTLFEQSCAACHGIIGQGTASGPALTNAGAAGADFMLSTGRMPLSGPGQPMQRHQPAYNESQIKALEAYVASLGSGPAIPQVSSTTDYQRGWQLYINDCAACHGAAAGGGAIGGGFVAPPLNQATSTQIAEAMIVGPGAMPVFDLSKADRDAIVSYVVHLRSTPSPGGLDLAGLGPVPEGFVAVIVGIGLLLLIVRRIEPPRRTEVPEGPEEGTEA